MLVELAASALLLAVGIALAVGWVAATSRKHVVCAARATERHASARPIGAGWLTSADEREIARWAR